MVEEKVPLEWKTNIIVPICKKKRETNYSVQFYRNIIIIITHRIQNTNHSYVH